MKPAFLLRLSLAVAVLPGLVSCISNSGNSPGSSARPPGREIAQMPAWSRGDLDFFLHGSMSTEVVPEPVLRAFIQIYPDLFPVADLSNLGLIPDPLFGWPVGFSRNRVPHLGGLPSVGVNCAACHVAEITPPSGGPPLRVLGVTSHFDAGAFFGAVTIATFRTADAANMKHFLAAYLWYTDPAGGEGSQKALADAWQKQEPIIAATIAADPGGTNGVAPGVLHQLNGTELRLDHLLLARNVNLALLSDSMLRLFHNMRASLHIPDQPPSQFPAPSGPGRNDSFGLLSAVLFNSPQPPAPVKYGVVWNLDKRAAVHWDGNTRSPIAHNLLAAIGLGAPLNGKVADLNFALVKRQTDLSEHILPPRYPFAFDEAAARRGAVQYQSHCASCHDGPETDQRLHSPAEVGTDPRRAELFTRLQADRFNNFLATLVIPGYVPPRESGIRATQQYWAPSLAGVWARSPYLHNGSVRTMQDLLTRPADRPKTFHRGSRVYDDAQMGYTDAGTFLFDTTVPGSANTGHNYGTDLSNTQKRELIEFLKTL